MPRFPSYLLRSEFPNTILHAFLISSMIDTFPYHIIILDLITLITVNDGYEL
jgi:hypothetical protein